MVDFKIEELAFLDGQIARLRSARAEWSATDLEERASLIEAIGRSTASIAEGWAEASARGKRIPSSSQLAGEEWLTGPYALIAYCNKLGPRLRQIASENLMSGFKLRDLPNGQVSARVFPSSIVERLLVAGTTVDVWMERGVTQENLADHIARVYQSRTETRVCVVLGAGNVASIAPLDCLHKLFFDNEVVLLKLNPVNAYLKPFLEAALRPLIDRNLLGIVEGSAEVGEYLCTHEDVNSLFITGSQAVHDAIVWGAGEEGAKRKAAGTPRNNRPIESELGGVGPTIIVPGPWNNGDIKYQAAHIATQKLQNEGHMCVACQVLILPDNWSKSVPLLHAVSDALGSAPQRPAYYPGSEDRAKQFSKRSGTGTLRCVVEFHAKTEPLFERSEVFGPVLTATRLPASSAEEFLKQAISYSNDHLYGTLGANIIIHPKTVKEIGAARFEELIAELRYGVIAINTWSGSAFVVANAAWGAFPGHTLDKIESGIGKVHNAMMFDRAERTVIRAPFRQTPLPPWFVTHKSALNAARALTRFEATRSPWALMKLVAASLRA